jgi:hypothetical protein
MKAEEYKRLVNEVDVLDYSTLDSTLKEVVARQEFEIASELQRILENNGFEKPDQHLKPSDAATNHFKVDLSADAIEKIIDILFELEARHVGEDGETAPPSAFYASLVDRWNKLASE